MALNLRILFFVCAFFITRFAPGQALASDLQILNSAMPMSIYSVLDASIVQDSTKSEMEGGLCAMKTKMD